MQTNIQEFLSTSSLLICNAARIFISIVFHHETPAALDIQRLLSEQISLFSLLPHMEIYHQWCLAITAVCAVSDDHRLFFLEKFATLSRDIQVVNANEMVEKCWIKTDFNINGNTGMSNGYLKSAFMGLEGLWKRDNEARMTI